MPSNPDTMFLPPWQKNPQQQLRRIGVELEMSGLCLDKLAEVVADFLQASVEIESRYQRVLKGDRDGDWLVELDFLLLRKMGQEQREAEGLATGVKNTVEEILKVLTEPLVPLEVVSPPLPMDRLAKVEKLIAALREAGAKGTSEKASNAFGMQLNPEIPSEDPRVLSAYLKAFLCLYDWLYSHADIDIARRLTRYVDPFPMDYVRKVVNPDYWPDTATLIDDYLKDNPTRNRALDLLPLFLHLDETRVRKITQDPLIKPRPTFHYRLPDCQIDRPDWGIHLAWREWLEVEYLAADADRLEACCRAYSHYLRQPVQRWLGKWKREIEEKWLSR